jgi:hypothetical protein
MNDPQIDDRGEPPPWIVSQPGPEGGYPTGPPGGRRPLALIVGAAVVLLIAVAAGGVYLIRQRHDPLSHRTAQTVADDGGRPGVSTEAPPTTVAPAPTEIPEPTELTADPQQAALEQLDAIGRRDLARVSPHGQYVAQLASKNPGTYDRFQTTADGSHTFSATDILDEHQRLRDDPANGGVPVVLLKSTDYGERQLFHGQPLYVTFALGKFGDRQDVLDWCARRFPDLSGEALTDQCTVRRLRPAA